LDINKKEFKTRHLDINKKEFKTRHLDINKKNSNKTNAGY
jgi:hypothetical protein